MGKIIRTRDNRTAFPSKNGFIIIKIGNDERPAGPEDIETVENQIEQTLMDPELTIITHHAFDVLHIPKLKPNQILVVKVGSEERPAGPADIEAIQKTLVDRADSDKNYIVTHHAVDFMLMDKPLRKVLTNEKKTKKKK